jgi:hypothetical protein
MIGWKDNLCFQWLVHVALSSWWVLTTRRNKTIDVNFQWLVHVALSSWCVSWIPTSLFFFSLPSMNYELGWGWNYHFAPTHHLLQPYRGWFMREGVVDGTRGDLCLRSFWGLARGQILLTYFGLRICGWSLETGDLDPAKHASCYSFG